MKIQTYPSRLVIILLTALVTLCLFTHAAWAETIVSPFKSITPPTANPKGEMFVCMATPEAVVDLPFAAIYQKTDPTGSQVNTKSESAYQAQVAPLNDYLSEVATMANIYTRSNGRNLSSAKCTMNWLYDWSLQNALTGSVTEQGDFVRKWALASISSAYVQIALDGRLPATQKVAIKKWIQKLTQIAMIEEPKGLDAKMRRNHRLYWTAWAVGVSSVAIQDKNLFNWAMQKAQIGLIQIEDDGTLPLEIRRGDRAQVYHLFAAAPLVMLAELGMKNGVDLYAYNKGALHKLVKMNIEQFYKPDYLKHRSGVKQDLKYETAGQHLTWIEPYQLRFGFPDIETTTQAKKILKQYRPLFDKRVGGDATLLFEPENPKRRTAISESAPSVSAN